MNKKAASRCATVPRNPLKSFAPLYLRQGAPRFLGNCRETRASRGIRAMRHGAPLMRHPNPHTPLRWRSPLKEGRAAYKKQTRRASFTMRGPTFNSDAASLLENAGGTIAP